MPFHQFKLDKKLLHIKMEVCERNSCVCVNIATRDTVIGEEQPKYERERDNKSDRQLHSFCKEGWNNRWPFATK